MMFLLLTGCATLVEGHCELDPHEVADDERIASGFTVKGALDALVPQTVDAIDLFGNIVTVEVSLARGEGAALFEDADTVEVVTRPGTNDGTRITWLGPDPCEDEATVPVVLTLAGDAVAATGAATLRVNLADPDNRVPVVAYTLDPAADRLPPGLSGAPVSGTVWATYRDDLLEDLEALVVTEDGTRETVLWYEDR